LGQFTIDCNSVAIKANYKQSHEVGIALPDPVAMAVALDPTIATRASKHYVDVETQSELTRGMTIVDQLNIIPDERNQVLWKALTNRDPNVQVVWEIDIPRWKEMLYSVLK
jgi:purine nucleosidase